MRNWSHVAACAAVLAAVTPAVAADAPVVVYGAAPAIVTLPPTGYILDPSDARRQIYVVNQGPTHGAWVGAIAQPTYSESGYVYMDDCPVEIVTRPRTYAYVRSHHGGEWFDAPPPHIGRKYHAPRYGEAAVGGPAAAYRYRTAPSARVITVDPRSVPEMHTSYRPR
jgi:hypothetical protein